MSLGEIAALIVLAAVFVLALVWLFRNHDL